MMFLALLLLWFPLPTLAATVFDDGGVHVIDGPGGAVEVLNGTTLLTVPGAEIGAVTSTDATLGVFGGLIDWRRVDGEFTIINGSGPAGIEATGGVVTVANGEVLGEGAGLRAMDVGALTISGGHVGGIPLGVVVDGDTTATITGGVIESLRRFNTFYNFLAAAHLKGSSDTMITGGLFKEAIDVGDVTHSLRVEDSAHVEIRGGVFEGRWVIRGPDAVVEVFGDFGADTIGFRGLEFPFGGQILRGVLEDGSPLDVAVTLEDGASPPIIHVMPEPSAVVLWLAVIGTLAGISRRVASTSQLSGTCGRQRSTT